MVESEVRQFIPNPEVFMPSFLDEVDKVIEEMSEESQEDYEKRMETRYAERYKLLEGAGAKSYYAAVGLNCCVPSGIVRRYRIIIDSPVPQVIPTPRIRESMEDLEALLSGTPKFHIVAGEYVCRHCGRLYDKEITEENIAELGKTAVPPDIKLWEDD